MHLLRCQMILFIPFLCQPSIHYKYNMLYYSLLNLYWINSVWFLYASWASTLFILRKVPRTWIGVSCCLSPWDGPTVNWKFLELMQQEQAEQFGGVQLIVVGSRGLDTLHNACKVGFLVWQLDKVLRVMHTLFHNTPARREDFTALTKTTHFPLPFFGHRWLENLPSVERALEV